MSLDVLTAPSSVPLALDASGIVRVKGSRVTLDSVIIAFEQGMTAEGIVQSYPTLKLEDVYAILAFLPQPSRRGSSLPRGTREAGGRRQATARSPSPGRWDPANGFSRGEAAPRRAGAGG